MTASDLLDRDDVRRRVDRLRRAVAGRAFSDVVDGEGRQYVDVVMEGGGVLGIALVGYVHALEQAGLRFLNVGGSSAGAATALLLAAAGPRRRPRAAALADVLAGQDLGALTDGGWLARRATRLATARRSPLRLLPYAPALAYGLARHAGLHPGHAFLEWVEGALGAFGVGTTADLDRRLADGLGGLRTRGGGPAPDAARVGVVAVELTTGARLELPRMAPLLWADPGALSPAVFVRASTSVPFFFRPLHVPDVSQGPGRADRWAREAGHDGAVGPTCTLVDGGVVSNFPIDMFHRAGSVPRCPTLGVKLGLEGAPARAVRGPLGLGLAVFEAARQGLDRAFVRRNPDYRHLVAFVDTGGHHWLDFGLSDGAKADLFVRGVEAGAAFLEGFDWDDYKAVRRALVGAHRPHAAA